jgi:hypothetical protein
VSEPPFESLRDRAQFERMDREIATSEAWLEQQHRDFRAHTATADKARSENRGRIMLLTAGIVGIVVPLLAKEPGLVSRGMLKVASICWLTSLSVAVLGQAVDRFTLKRITDAFNVVAVSGYEARLLRRAAIVRETEIPDPNSPAETNSREAIDALDDARKFRQGIATLEDILVYGTFITGVVVLGRGLW